MPKRNVWQSLEGVLIDVWDLPVGIRRRAAVALGPVDRLIRVRASADRALLPDDDVMPIDRGLPRPSGRHPFVETWLVVAGAAPALRVLHVLSTTRGTATATTITELELPRDLLDDIASCRGVLYRELRQLLLADLVHGTTLLEQPAVGSAVVAPNAGHAQPWTPFVLHEGGAGLRQILHLLPSAQHIFRRDVRWIEGPVSGVYGHLDSEPGPDGTFDDVFTAMVRLAGEFAWHGETRHFVVELAPVRVGAPRDAAQMLDDTWWALLNSCSDARSLVAGVWLVDGRTHIGDAVRSAVPGIALAGWGRSGAARTDLVAQLQWSWLLNADAVPPAHEP
jgi:hypothetical protein